MAVRRSDAGAAGPDAAQMTGLIPSEYVDVIKSHPSMILPQDQGRRIDEVVEARRGDSHSAVIRAGQGRSDRD